jgi:hypothetical protein
VGDTEVRKKDQQGHGGDTHLMVTSR